MPEKSVKSNIVMVEYQKSDGSFGGCQYSYQCDIPVILGETVCVPVGKDNRRAKAVVVEVDVDPLLISFNISKLKKVISIWEDEPAKAEEGEDEERDFADGDPLSDKMFGSDSGAKHDEVLPEYSPDIDAVISLKQLPEIREQLATMKSEVAKRTKKVTALECTEGNLSEVKKIRAAMNKEFEQFEERRKLIKNQILAPYEQFESVYKDCIAIPYKDADKELKERITTVEDTLKDDIANKARIYFNEYALSQKVSDFADFEKCVDYKRKKYTLNELKRNSKVLIDQIAKDVKAIETQPEELRAEIYAEFKLNLSASESISTVSGRHKQMAEQEKLRKEREEQKRIAAEAAQKAAQAMPPAPVDAPVRTRTVLPAQPPAEEKPQAAEQIITAAFKVKGTLAQLKALKNFLEEGNYDYE